MSDWRRIGERVVLAIHDEQHGYEIATDDAEIVAAVTALASGQLDEAGFAEWVRRVMAPEHD